MYLGGMPEVKRALADYTRTKVASAVKEAADIVIPPLVNEMRLRCPVDTGALRASLGLRAYTVKRNYVYMYVLGVRRRFVKYNKKPSRYAHLVEFGVPAYGTPAQPFIRPAFEMARTTTVNAMAFVLRGILRARGMA